MDDKLKQRTVGAIILVSLAIIFIPLLLDGEDAERRMVAEQIPAPPHIVVDSTSVSEVQERIQTNSRKSAARMPKETVDLSDYSGEPDPSLDRDGLPLTWALQVGSFKEKTNAVNLRARLREQNYRSYILHIEPVYRVLVGPNTSKEKLERMADQIEARMKLRGKIVRHDVKLDVHQLGG